MNLNNWISDTYICNVEELQRKFSQNSPFAHLSLNDFFIESKAEKILENIEQLEYYTEENDLYRFSRTVDIKNIDNSFLKELREFIFSQEFREFISKVTGIENLSKKGDLHSLKLNNGDHLLCHDDQVQNRSIAFIINLSKNWTQEDGGELELFSSKDNIPIDVVKSILPEFNQFNIFRVSNTSFHQIAEVLNNKDRISISGWFYEN